MSYCQAIETMQPKERRALHKNCHDNHYNFPIHNDDELFGRLIMQIDQAGSSRETILKKNHFGTQKGIWFLPKIAETSSSENQGRIGRNCSRKQSDSHVGRSLPSF